MERVIAAKVELQGRSREIEGEEVEVEGVEGNQETKFTGLPI